MRWVGFCWMLACSAPLAYGVDKKENTKKSVSESVTQIAWDNPQSSNLVDEFLKSYSRLFVEFPRLFSPYNLDEEVKPKELRHQICDSARLKSFCEDKEFKLRIEKLLNEGRFADLYKQKVEGHDNLPSSNERFYDSWHKIQSTTQYLRAYYAKFHEVYHKELKDMLSNPKTFESLASFNKALSKVEFNTETESKEYQRQYRNRTVSYPERLLLNKIFVDLLEGQFYLVERIDMIRALDATIENLEETFLQDLKDPKGDLKNYQLWSDAALSFDASLDGISHTKIPRVQSQKHFELLKRFNNGDSIATDFILRNSYQRAVWQLRDMDNAALANEFETVIEKELFNPKSMTMLKPLGGGASTTLRATFEEKLRCVYKPSTVNLLKNPVDLFMNTDHEVVASRMDRLLDLRGVPLTFNTTLGGYDEGSCQYFVENSANARKMLQYNGIKPGKYSDPRGRAIKNNDMKFFDWLINNKDRNVDNYILAADGRVVLIDHGYSFVHFPLDWIEDIGSVSWKKLKKMLPSERIYKNLKYLHENPEILKREVGELLSKDRFLLLERKIESVVKLVEKRKPYQVNS